MRTRLSIILLMLVAAGGCQTARVSQPLTGTVGGNDPDAQLEFWHQLSQRPLTSNDEAFHGLLLYLDGTDAGTNYDVRVTALKSRGILAGDFREPGEQAVSRGTLAVAIAKSLQIKGGLLLHIDSTSPRYAVRELVYQDLFPPSTENQTFSGSEFLGIIGRMEDYQRGNPAEQPATVLPQEMKSADAH